MRLQIRDQAGSAIPTLPDFYFNNIPGLPISLFMSIDMNNQIRYANPVLDQGKIRDFRRNFI